MENGEHIYNASRDPQMALNTIPTFSMLNRVVAAYV